MGEIVRPELPDNQTDTVGIYSSVSITSGSKNFVSIISNGNNHNLTGIPAASVEAAQPVDDAEAIAEAEIPETSRETVDWRDPHATEVKNVLDFMRRRGRARISRRSLPNRDK